MTVLFQTSVYASVKGNSQEGEGDVNIKYIHIFSSLSVASFRKYWLKTKAVPSFWFTCLMVHQVKAEPQASFQKAPTSFLVGKNPYFVWPSEYSWPYWNTWANFCPGKAKAVKDWCLQGLLYRGVKSSGRKVTVAMHIYILSSLKIKGWLKIGSIWKYTHAHTSGSSICLNLWEFCQGQSVPS